MAKDSRQSSMEDTKASSKHQEAASPTDFETAIDAAGFGLFNVLLLIAALFAAIGSVFETSTMSFILPTAECDLQLTLLDKGTLNAITYAGMITSAIFWGYFADALGRKRLLATGFLLDSLCVLGSAMSQNTQMLMVFKYFGGFIVCGPFAVLMSYMAELHSKRFRARIMMLTGMMFSVASLTLPALALGILPNAWNFQLAELNFHSWHIFLAVTAVPSLLSGLFLSFFPESPKFLMSQGRNAEALEVFRKIYAMNTHKPKDSYPIVELVNETAENERSSCGSAETAIATIEACTPAATLEEKKQSTKAALRQGLLQLRPLFMKPYLGLSLHVYLLNLSLLFGQNTMRLWLPQLFASIEEYQRKLTDSNSDAEISMCAILEYSVNKTVAGAGNPTASCEVLVGAGSYMNNIIVSIAGFIGYIFAIATVNLIGSKMMLTCGLLITSICGIALYWSSSALSTLSIASIFVTFGSISSTSVIGASANLFPTSLRTMILSLTMMFGRSGSLMGNLLFPTFMALGCIPPIVMISGMMFFASVLSAFLPNTTKVNLK